MQDQEETDELHETERPKVSAATNDPFVTEDWRRERKGLLLLKYAEPGREVHDFDQLDGFVGLGSTSDYVMRPDKDGDWLSRSRTSEIRHTDSDLAVRVLIHAEADPKAAARVLQKLADWYALIADPQAHEAQERLEPPI